VVQKVYAARVRFPLTEILVAEAKRFALRSSCRDCAFWNAGAGECWHRWPDEGQRRWPLDARDPVTGEIPREVAFCKEFELR
jgi:hypothetical protein